mgnify:CR=1 FL=1
MWKLIVGNPWALAALFALGLASGAGGAWWVQGLRLDAVQAKYDGFVATTKAQGEAAKKEAEAKAKADRQLKESSDHEYETTIASLRADVKRMRDDRARASFVPAAPAGSRSPGLACFDRADLEQALRRLDVGISGLIEEGDADAVGLNAGRRWAAGIGSGKSPDSPASAQP